MNLANRTTPFWETEDFICCVIDHDDAALPVRVDGKTETVSIGDALVVVVRGKLSHRSYKSVALWPRASAIERAMVQAEAWRPEFAGREDDTRQLVERMLPAISRICPTCGAQMDQPRISRRFEDTFQTESYVCPNGHAQTWRRNESGDLPS